MFRFKNIDLDYTYIYKSCFNTSYVSVQANSINQDANSTSKFQYILCFGSSLHYSFIQIHKDSFQYILCFGSRQAPQIPQQPILLFQYILCFGSRI